MSTLLERTRVAWLWRAVVWSVLLGALALVTVAVLVPRVAGATPYTILTGSMRTTMPPGTLVVVKPVDFDDVKRGDVITFQLHSGEPEVATHRVVGVATNLAGERTLRTQGDANPAQDPDPVREAQVKGRVWYSVPQIGRVSLLFSGQQREYGIYAVVAGLFGYAAWMFVGTGRDAARRKEER